MSTNEIIDEHIVGQVSEFAVGAHKVVRVGNLELGIFNVDGAFYALPNICPHQFGPLSKGPVGGEMICGPETDWHLQWVRDGEILTCPWHGLEFEIKTGQCLAPHRFNVRTFPVRVVDGNICVRLRPARP